MTPKQAVEKYGKKAWRKMPRYLREATIGFLPTGEEDLSEFELENAYKRIEG